MAASDDGDVKGVSAAQQNKRHLKCDYDSAVCTRCQRDGERCVRGRTKIKFRHGSSARYDSGFAKDQTWLKTSGKSRQLKYIDETGDVAAYYNGGYDGLDTDGDSAADEGEAPTSAPTSMPIHTNVQTRSMGPPPPVQREEPAPQGLGSPPKRRKTNDAESPRVQNINSPNGHGNMPAMSPSLSFLNFQSPPARNGLAFSPPVDISTPFDYGSLFGLNEHDFGSSSVTNSGYKSFFMKESPKQEAFLSSLVKQPSLTPVSTSDQADPGRLEAVLLRHFVENLAKWFDLCDPEKHFELVVPQRARSSPTLMNALLTASARHLTRLNIYKTASGIVQWEGQLLPELTAETALHYSNKCLQDLIRMSMDPHLVHDENLLAACIILRFYEEVDSPLREDGDGEVFLRAINTFVSHQVPELPALPHSSPQINHATKNVEYANPQISSPSSSSQHTHSSAPSNSIPLSSDPTPRITRADGLRQAAFWVGFRQEIYAAFIKQRRFTFPLSRCEAFRSFDPAEDAVWADRLIIFCADVLEFCHGDESISKRSPQATRERWLELKQYEKTWSTVLPASFEPIFFKEPDRSRGDVFPEIWYLADCHVAGIQHVELARILLAVYDPTRPKLGPGHFASMKKMSQELKAIVLRLCGIALSNRRTPPGIVTACLGIAMCGEHFEDRIEQEALLGVLTELETRHAWPVGNTVEILKSAWGWDE